ncbi:hypothetical protein [Flavobacterium hydrophilum]|uniref:Lipocalin-like domain-containing protein n=1 Tax=Flavobacterium hydrophilum TaxID=2211445 RepID=A0A2V4C127_9FLAO|nr:hypothetical protein [Flavobacterium hydrophilum]PXY45016.1 hypothetical protein DMB68_09890 [Flavobacterium hydrophilum]
MNKTIVILLMILCISCSKKKETESIFIAEKDEYWVHHDYCYNTGGNCFHFNENGSYDRFLVTPTAFRLANNDGDLINDPGTWSIKNDSTFVWDKGVFKIEKITKKQILLSYYHYESKGIKCFVRLSKWIQTPQGPKPVDSLDNVK